MLGPGAGSAALHRKDALRRPVQCHLIAWHSSTCRLHWSHCPPHSAVLMANTPWLCDTASHMHAACVPAALLPVLGKQRRRGCSSWSHVAISWGVKISLSLYIVQINEQFLRTKGHSPNAADRFHSPKGAVCLPQRAASPKGWHTHIARRRQHSALWRRNAVMSLPTLFSSFSTCWNTNLPT